MDNSELQKRHFAALKEKYQIGQDKATAPDRFLYMILRKAELGIQVTNIEIQWLAENGLGKTVEIISLQQYEAEDKQRLEAEFIHLGTKYEITEDLELPFFSPVYSILWKLDTGDPEYILTDSEIEILTEQGLADTITLIENIRNFSKLKVDYKATKHIDKFPEEPLYSILNKLDARQQLSDSEAEWLLEQDFDETLEIYWQQEEERKAVLEFLELKSRYEVDYHPETSIFSPLYSILRKFNSEERLERSELEWLKQQQLTELIAIARVQDDRRLFVRLKNKYQATQYQSSDTSSPLFLILRNLELNIEYQISEADIQWLREEGLIEIEEIVKDIHFRSLKSKYQIVGPLARDPFYEIMLKLEREERLDPKQVIQLMEEGRLSRHGKIAIAHYKLEAMFCEKEYKRTGDRWKLPAASSNWRKADAPEKALQVTENVNWHKIKESDLKSALLVTRGAAFRDLNRLDEAENCATQAKKCQPDSHRPYTLMGAIYYDLSEYSEGDRWFEMAAERGAKADDVDDEIKRIVRMTKDRDKRREVAEYLLKKDQNRYGWAKSYLK